MKVTLLLRNDHEMLRNLLTSFRKVRARGATNRKQLLENIQQQVALHSKTESEIFYPALTATSSDRAAGLVSTALKGQQNIEALLRELSEMSASDENFDLKMDNLIDEVGHHIRMNEEEMFREARQSLPERRLEELGNIVQRRRGVLVRSTV